MSRTTNASDYDVGVTPEPLCIVDDPFGRLDPVLVVQTSPRIADASDNNWYRFVEFFGDLDTYTASHVKAALDKVAADGGDVVVDLAGVSFCDSAGVRLIEVFCDRIVANQGHISVHACSRAVRRLTSILQIEHFGLCEPSTSARRPLSYETSPSSPRRIGPCDGPDARVEVGNDGGRVVPLLELPGGREHVSRRRLTIDAVLSLRSNGVSPTVRHRRSARIVVRGELDGAVESASIDDWCCLDGVDDVTVDLSAVTIMTSAGLGLIERLEQRVRALGGCFVVENPSPIVRRLLDIVDVRFDQTDSDSTAHTERLSAPRSSLTHRRPRAIAGCPTGAGLLTAPKPQPGYE